MTADPRAKIAEAHVAMIAGDRATALARLVDAWRMIPDATLAETIDSIGPHAARGLQPPTGIDDDDRDQAWLAAAARDDAAMRHHLLATLSESFRTADRWRALLEHRDPRVARVFLEQVVAGDRSPGTDAFVYQQLGACGDPRILARADDIDAGTLRRTSHGADLDARRRRIARDHERLRAIFEPQLVQLTALASEHARLAEIATLAAAPNASTLDDARTEDELLDAIFAAPGDLVPREVYADWLQQRGDPRGEYIALSLRGTTRDDEMRAYSLLQTHRDRLLGALAPHVSGNGLQLERGFVARCMPTFGVEPPALREWATVHTVVGCIPATDEHPMPLLHTATHLDHRGLERLASLASPPPLVHVDIAIAACTPGTHDPRHVEARDAYARLKIPTLKSLSLGVAGFSQADFAPETLEWPWRAHSIETLELHGGPEHISRWLAAATPTSLTCVRFPRALDWKIELSRAAGDSRWRIAITSAKASYRHKQSLDEICAALDALAPDTASEIALDIDPRAWRVTTRKAMARVLARQPRVDPATLSGYNRG